MEYHIMGNVSQICIKPGCFPSKFDCQPDRRKRISNVEIPHIFEKQKMMELGEPSNETSTRRTGGDNLIPDAFGTTSGTYIVRHYIIFNNHNWIFFFQFCLKLMNMHKLLEQWINRSKRL